jgi:uncharacterized protein (TIGR02246 family)
MTRKLEVWLLIVACALVIGSVWAQNVAGTLSADQAAIQHMLDRYTATVDAGNIDAWMALWAPGGVQMPPDTAMRSGLDAIRAGMAPALTKNKDDIRIHTLEITVVGDLGYARGVYTLDVTPLAGGATGHVDGKFLTVFRRQPDGSWKIYRDIFNSNVPPG